MKPLNSSANRYNLFSIKDRKYIVILFGILVSIIVYSGIFVKTNQYVQRQTTETLLTDSTELLFGLSIIDNHTDDAAGSNTHNNDTVSTATNNQKIDTTVLLHQLSNIDENNYDPRTAHNTDDDGSFLRYSTTTTSTKKSTNYLHTWFPNNQIVDTTKEDDTDFDSIHYIYSIQNNQGSDSDEEYDEYSVKRDKDEEDEEEINDDNTIKKWIRQNDDKKETRHVAKKYESIINGDEDDDAAEEEEEQRQQEDQNRKDNHTEEDNEEDESRDATTEPLEYNNTNNGADNYDQMVEIDKNNSTLKEDKSEQGTGDIGENTASSTTNYTSTKEPTSASNNTVSINAIAILNATAMNDEIITTYDNTTNSLTATSVTTTRIMEKEGIDQNLTSNYTGRGAISSEEYKNNTEVINTPSTLSEIRGNKTQALLDNKSVDTNITTFKTNETAIISPSQQDENSSNTTAYTVNKTQQVSNNTHFDNKQEDTNTSTNNKDDTDIDCPFRNSPIYRKVYVYPSPNNVDEWQGDMLSETGKSNNFTIWPWLELDAIARNNSYCHYNIYGQNVQYSTELVVRELLTNPKSCLRTYNPDEAVLFYVPYLPSVEHHVGIDNKFDFSTSIYAMAIQDILDYSNYTAWETVFGLSSKYWKRNGGADHILVYSEPLHGLSHPRSKRGNYHYIYTQKQLAAPIVISVELSTTFVSMYPKCAAKNILVPYPNTAGTWFNGYESTIAFNEMFSSNLSAVDSIASLESERLLHAKHFNTTTITSLQHLKAGNSSSASYMMLESKIPRSFTQYYSAYNHGTCTKLRRAMKQDYDSCSKSSKLIASKQYNQATSMRLSTFCPCPGGDSPGAKRMFDAILAGCIPVILSYDFVWPFSTDIINSITLPDTSNNPGSAYPILNPTDFSIRLTASDYDNPLLDSKTCQPFDTNKPGLEAYLQSIPMIEIQRLRTNVAAIAQSHYNWYAPRADLPDNPLREGVLPDGGLAHMVVASLAERSTGTYWTACQQELHQINNENRGKRKKNRRSDPSRFVCR